LADLRKEFALAGQIGTTGHSVGMLPSLVSQGSKAAKLANVAKFAGVTGAGLSVGVGVWELCVDPNKICKLCK
jgi:malonyl CoA-acyl carrier protein transacylase